MNLKIFRDGCVKIMITLSFHKWILWWMLAFLFKMLFCWLNFIFMKIWWNKNGKKRKHSFYQLVFIKIYRAINDIKLTCILSVFHMYCLHIWSNGHWSNNFIEGIFRWVTSKVSIILNNYLFVFRANDSNSDINTLLKIRSKIGIVDIWW